MSIFADAIKGFLSTLLLKPLGWRDCPPFYEFGTTKDTEGACYPNIKLHPDLQVPYKRKLLKIVNPNAEPQDIIWERAHQLADTSGVANSSNCAPNTYPFNGSCLSHCPQGWVERAYPDNDPEKVSRGIKDFLYECVAECSQSWHPFTWDSPKSLFSEYDDNERNIIWTSGAITFMTGGGIDRFKQLEQRGSLWCYHASPSEKDGLTLGYSRTPFNIQPYEVTGSGVAGGLGSNKFRAMHVGLYGERARLALGAPRMAGACPPPNVVGDGVCYRPTPPEMELIGNEWFTQYKCPAQFSIPDDGGKQCIVKHVARAKWPSLLELILYIVGLGLIVFIIVKAIQIARK